MVARLPTVVSDVRCLGSDDLKFITWSVPPSFLFAFISTLNIYTFASRFQWQSAAFRWWPFEKHHQRRWWGCGRLWCRIVNIFHDSANTYGFTPLVRRESHRSLPRWQRCAGNVEFVPPHLPVTLVQKALGHEGRFLHPL